MTDIIFRDINAAVIAAIKALDPNADAEVGSIFAPNIQAVVSPGNSFGYMDGGIDALYMKRFGHQLQGKLQARVRDQPLCELLVGDAIVQETEDIEVRFVICAPTMRVPMRILDPINIFLACRAATMRAMNWGFQRVAMPGMGTGCGEVRPDIAARAMLNGIAEARNPSAFPTSWSEAWARHFREIR